jgi:transcriptional regulator of acetoin/glycerol metabolism
VTDAVRRLREERIGLAFAASWNEELVLERYENLPDEVRTPTPGSDRSNDEQPSLVAGDLREAERQAILAQVRDCDGNLTQAARRLGIARSTLYLRLAKYGRRPAVTS